VRFDNPADYQTGGPLAGLTATLTLVDGTVMQALTGSFGYYRFEGIPAGQNVVLGIHSKHFRFAQSAILLDVGDSLAAIDFVAEY